VILYWDSSALVKRYVQEAGSVDVRQLWTGAQSSATGLITRAEVSAAIGRAVRMNYLSFEQALAVLQVFRREWESIARLPIQESTVQRADELAFRRTLRGYDAVHLACALQFQDGLGLPVALVTYDRELGQAAQAEGLAVFPAVLSG
jgi:predicted nucleic acid-binding protein